MKKQLLYFLTFLFLCFNHIAFAQLKDLSKIPDSLKTKTIDELKSQVVSHIFEKKMYEKAIVFVNAYLAKSIEEQDAMGELSAYNYFHLISKNTGRYNASLKYINKSIEVAQHHNIKKNIMMLLYRNKGVAYFQLGNYKEALRFHLKDLNIARELKDYNRELSANHNIALMKLNLGDKKDALKILKRNIKAFDSLIKNGAPEYLGVKINNLNSLGKNYTSLKQLDSAMITYEESYRLSKEHKFKIHETFVLAGIGHVYSLQGKYDKAIPYLDRSLKQSDSLKRKDLLPYIYVHQGRVYYGLKQYEKAIKILKKTDSIIEVDKPLLYELQECYALLANSYDAIDDYKNAKENYKKFIAIDSKNDGQKMDIVNEIYDSYDLKSLETKIDHLTQKTDTQKKQLLSTKTIIIILTLVILGLFGFFQYKAHQNKKRFEALLKKLETKKEKKPVLIKKKDRKELISKEKAEELLKQLQRLEKQHAYLDPNCTISWLAKKMNTNASYVSIIINDFMQKKFPDYLSERRINYATERLKEDRKFRSYTIKSIAMDVGYKSPEAFSKAFKKLNGIYPSYFIKKLNQQTQNAA